MVHGDGSKKGGSGAKDALGKGAGKGAGDDNIPDGKLLVTLVKVTLMS